VDVADRRPDSQRSASSLIEGGLSGGSKLDDIPHVLDVDLTAGPFADLLDHGADQWPAPLQSHGQPKLTLFLDANTQGNSMHRPFGCGVPADEGRERPRRRHAFDQGSRQG
jgi:hypothetical protein